jgi:hypothetical protein
VTVVALSTIRFRGLIAPEEPAITADSRIFTANSLTHRRLPRPVMFTRTLGPGRHVGAVAVARLEAVEYVPGRGWTGSGTFLDPRIVPEVTEAVYLVKEGVSSPSVDLQPDVTAEIVPHPLRPEEPAIKILTGRLMGFTFVPYPAFEEVEITVTDPAEEAVLASAGITFAINSSTWRSFPIAERETEFNYDLVVPRLVEWSGGAAAKFRRAFLYQAAGGDVTSTESYLLPVADVIDGRLTLIPRAVFSAAAFLSGAHGGLPQVPEPDQERLRNVVTDIYDVLRERFGDPRLRPPWTRGGRQDARGAHDMEPHSTTTGNEVTFTFTNVDPKVFPILMGETFQDDGGDCGNIDTPDAADLNTAARECAARRGWAMEGGRYPIRSKELHGASDLAKAIKAVGRGGGSHDEIRRHIMKRARSLGLSDQIPDEWTSSGNSPNTESEAAPTTFQDTSEEHECPEGKHWDEEQEKCVADEESNDSGEYGIVTRCVETAGTGRAPIAGDSVNPATGYDSGTELCPRCYAPVAGRSSQPHGGTERGDRLIARRAEFFTAGSGVGSGESRSAPNVGGKLTVEPLPPRPGGGKLHEGERSGMQTATGYKPVSESPGRKCNCSSNSNGTGAEYVENGFNLNREPGPASTLTLTTTTQPAGSGHGSVADAMLDSDRSMTTQTASNQPPSTSGITVNLLRPPRSWFENPCLDRATPLTITDQGRVYGTLASWQECHMGIGNRCITAPHSATDYALFKVGEVRCNDGSEIPVGKITLGTGHADPQLGMIPAVEHYDNSGTCVAVTNIGEDKFGIWVAGALVPGVSDEKVAELRRSPLSGDWRKHNGNLELVAALAVNTPGFPVLRASADSEDDLEVLLAAGVVTQQGPVDRGRGWKLIEDVVRTERVKTLFGGE